MVVRELLYSAQILMSVWRHSAVWHTNLLESHENTNCLSKAMQLWKCLSRLVQTSLISPAAISLDRCQFQSGFYTAMLSTWEMCPPLHYSAEQLLKVFQLSKSYRSTYHLKYSIFLTLVHVFWTGVLSCLAHVGTSSVQWTCLYLSTQTWVVKNAVKAFFT